MNRFIRKHFTALILTLILFFTLSTSVFGVNTDSLSVIPGGTPFGVKFFTDGVIVTAIDSLETDTGSYNPAKNSGIQLKDIITHIDGKKVSSASSVSKAISECNGNELTLKIKRGASELTVKLLPVKCGDGYKAGLWLKDSTAGIGTVTFIIPESGVFAGLGHGICDSDTGTLLPLLRGNVSNVRIGGIKKGISGTPGELKGYFTGGKTGSLIKNTEHGVYGVLSNASKASDTVQIGGNSFIHDGNAKIICTLDESGPKEYDIIISSISSAINENKNFIVNVVDTALLEKTGGIVQGMSGSPIIQDGRLVGAVTHVLINDPTRGYGILIENMLDSTFDLSN